MLEGFQLIRSNESEQATPIHFSVVDMVNGWMRGVFPTRNNYVAVPGVVLWCGEFSVLRR